MPELTAAEAHIYLYLAGEYWSGELANMILQNAKALNDPSKAEQFLIDVKTHITNGNPLATIPPEIDKLLSNEVRASLNNNASKIPALVKINQAYLDAHYDLWLTHSNLTDNTKMKEEVGNLFTEIHNLGREGEDVKILTKVLTDTNKLLNNKLDASAYSQNAQNLKQNVVFVAVAKIMSGIGSLFTAIKRNTIDLIPIVGLAPEMLRLVPVFGAIPAILSDEVSKVINNTINLDKLSKAMGKISAESRAEGIEMLNENLLTPSESPESDNETDDFSSPSNR